MENYLEKNGLKWKSYETQETLWETFNKKDHPNTYDDTDKIVYLFERHGCLIVTPEGILAQKINSTGEKLPDELFSGFRIYVRSIEMEDEEENTFEVIENQIGVGQEGMDAFVQNNINDDIKEQFMPEYRLKKLFQPEEADKELKWLLLRIMQKKCRIIEEVIGDGVGWIINGILAHCQYPLDLEKHKRGVENGKDIRISARKGFGVEKFDQQENAAGTISGK